MYLNIPWSNALKNDIKNNQRKKNMAYQTKLTTFITDFSLQTREARDNDRSLEYFF